MQEEQLPQSSSVPVNTVADERLQKLIARAGIASRRAAEELIASGRVTVNGEVAKELGAKANPQTDRITVDGKVLALGEKTFTVLLLHKPRSTVTTKSDPEKRATVLDLLPRKYQTLHPIGRLDFDTSGVLLLTDDGALTHLLTHPSHGVEKVYHVRVGGQMRTDTLKALQNGVWIGEGAEKAKTAPCRVKLVAQTESNALLEIALREGRNRQVRRMMEAVGHPVSSLRRVSFAGVELEGLPSGAHRVLLPGEVHELKKRAAKQLERAQRNLKEPKRAAQPKSPRPARAKATPRSQPKSPSKPKSAPTALGERIRREWK
jgi:pseudouridine synthase